MVSLASLWLPIVLSAVAVFIVSSLVWMVFPWHKKDYRGVPNEPRAREALRDAAPGVYMIPHCTDRKEMQAPEHRKKLAEGPVALLTVLPKGDPSMSRQLVIWFLWALFVSFTVAYVASETLTAGVEYLKVFQIVGTTAWLAYSWATVHEGIWFGRPWSHVAKHLFDGLLYALVTAGFFGWLWPS
jgi:hypothetical protein